MSAVSSGPNGADPDIVDVHLDNRARGQQPRRRKWYHGLYQPIVESGLANIWHIGQAFGDSAVRLSKYGAKPVNRVFGNVRPSHHIASIATVVLTVVPNPVRQTRKR